MKPKTVLAVAFIATGLGGMPIWLLSAYSPFVIESLGLSSALYGLLIATFFGVSALTGIWLGGSTARNGWINGVAYTSILSAIGLLVIALLANSWLIMALGIVVSAFANSMSQPAANLAIASVIRQKRMGLAFGIKQAALPVATLLVGASAPLFRFEQGWRAAFGLIAIFSLSFGAFVQLRTRNRLATPLEMAVASRASRAKSNERTFSKPLILLAIAAGLGTATTMTFAGFLVLYAVEIGLTAQQGAFVLSVGSFTGIVSRVVSGYLADRRTGRHLVVVSVMMVGGALGYLLVALSSDIILLSIASILAFGLGWAWNGVFHLAIVRSNPNRAANSTGVIQSGMALGATFGPAAFGLALTLSFKLAWLALAVCMLMAAIMVIVGRRALNR